MSDSNPLITLLNIEGRILTAGSKAEIGFVAVNEAHGLVNYRQAALWSAKAGVETVSGLALPEANAPFLLWLDQVFRTLSKEGPISAADLPGALAEQWAEWLPAHGLLLPLGPVSLLFARDEDWTDNDYMLLNRLGAVVKVAWRAFDPPSPFAWFKPKDWAKDKKVRAVAAAVFLVAIFPVTGSVLAPAEMVPAGPAMVRSPLDGVVDRIHVKPNEHVVEGQPLFDLDVTTLAGRLDVARQQQATAATEYRQAAQAQLFDPKAKAQVAILAGKADEKGAEAKWLESQLDRIRVKAPRAGIAVFDDASEWIGRPVAVGERVMLVADETDTEIEAWLAVADAGEAAPGAPLTLFLNTQPLSPVRAKVRTVAYEASARPDGTLGYRVRAALEGANKPRLGLKGTARIDSENVPLVWWLFRRPLATIRQTIGF